MKRLVLCVAVSVLAGVGQLRAGIIVSDQDFNESDWSHFEIFAPIATIQLARQESSGGNPNAYQHVQHAWEDQKGFIYDGHLYLPETYAPATQGAITTLDIAFDLRSYRPPSAASTTFGILLEQDGRRYIHEVPGGFSSDWQTRNMVGLTTGDSWWEVRPVSPPLLGNAPDFSALGSPITFGYYAFSITPGATGPDTFGYAEWGIDNFAVNVNTIPEPTTLIVWSLLGASGVGIGWWRRRKPKA